MWGPLPPPRRFETRDLAIPKGSYEWNSIVSRNVSCRFYGHSVILNGTGVRKIKNLFYCFVLSLSLEGQDHLMIWKSVQSLEECRGSCLRVSP